MGTNYYADDDATCNNPAHVERLHVGKSSGGWKFGFHGIPTHEPALTSWAAWREFLTGRTIWDEYGRALTLDEFADVVEKRYTPTGRKAPLCRARENAQNEWHRDYHDDEGFDFYDGEFC